jgi:hypothetical protein
VNIKPVFFSKKLGKSKPFLEIFCPVLETSAAALSMVVAKNKTLAFEKFVKIVKKVRAQYFYQLAWIRQKRIKLLQMFIKKSFSIGKNLKYSTGMCIFTIL